MGTRIPRRRSFRALSPRWQGVAVRGQRLVDGIPLWLIGSALLVLLAIVYVGLRWSLANSADGLFDKLAAFDAKKVQLAAPPPPPPPAPKPRLAGGFGTGKRKAREEGAALPDNPRKGGHPSGNCMGKAQFEASASLAYFAVTYFE